LLEHDSVLFGDPGPDLTVLQPWALPIVTLAESVLLHPLIDSEALTFVWYTAVDPRPGDRFKLPDPDVQEKATSAEAGEVT
jgi:hypothetical protein